MVWRHPGCGGNNITGKCRWGEQQLLERDAQQVLLSALSCPPLAGSTPRVICHLSPHQPHHVPLTSYSFTPCPPSLDITLLSSLLHPLPQTCRTALGSIGLICCCPPPPNADLLLPPGSAQQGGAGQRGREKPAVLLWDSKDGQHCPVPASSPPP